MKTYGKKFKISKEYADSLRNFNDNLTIGIPFGGGSYEEITPLLETKRGAILAIIGEIWDFHQSNVVKYIVKRVKK